MRFLIDAQLPPGLADYLEVLGHHASHVDRIGMRGASDAEIFRHAREIDAVIITKDVDFLTLVRAIDTPPQLVWIRVGNVTNAALKTLLDRVLCELVQALEAGEMIVEVR